MTAIVPKAIIVILMALLLLVMLPLYVVGVLLDDYGRQQVRDFLGIGSRLHVWEGRALIVDGDTLKMEKGTVRIFGIDAFEDDQACEWRSSREEVSEAAKARLDAIEKIEDTDQELMEWARAQTELTASGDIKVVKETTTYECGANATRHLGKLIGSDALTCVGERFDRYGRLLATCSTAQHRDLGMQMVLDGWALAYIEYSNRYQRDERNARDKRHGAWDGVCEVIEGCMVPDNMPPWEWRKEHKQ